MEEAWYTLELLENWIDYIIEKYFIVKSGIDMFLALTAFLS